MVQKKALLIGCSYENDPKSHLKGTKNDVIRLRNKLISKFGYTNESVQLLIEHPGYTPPTAQNIVDALIDLILQTRRGECDECFISFSGHGTSIRDTNGDEKDGMDECILAIDNKIIPDDHLAYYFQFFAPWCKAVVLVDACHSGSALDLQYEINPITGQHKLLNQNPKCSASVVFISGCRDHECSLDVFHRGKAAWGGLCTFSILQVLEDNDCEELTWHELVNKSREYIKKKGCGQIPQLSASKTISADCKMCVSHDGGKTFDFNM
tara:strand:+ start:1540 stop:2340 length:801 start_codon:yes stop_codon:yes gene_type:complete